LNLAVSKCSQLRYWHEVTFKPTYSKVGKTLYIEHWAARIQWRGRRESFNLRTSNKAAAAAKARDIYTTLVSAGWDETLERFKPEMARKSVSSVGDFLNELRAHWSASQKRSRIIVGVVLPTTTIQTKRAPCV
jgi:hypothetical protein